jgi:hypothetical protein
MISILAAAAALQTASPSPAPVYSDPATWLCRPGRKDSCSQDGTATVIAADGGRATQTFRPATDPGFDCFYVYPTVSNDKSPNSDLVANEEEQRVIQFQAARFGGVCRVFAPLYRQVTLTALRSIMGGGQVAVDRMMAYADVKAAWDDYLTRDNRGRGVVLIGHSQGSGVLKQLIAREIEGKPVAARMISAMLIGTNVAVPRGKDVGGDFKMTPLCRTPTQTGCVVSYVSFRSHSPPPPNSRFGRATEAGMEVACTNPAALAGGKAVTRNYLGATGAGTGSAVMAEWSKDGAAVTTPFVSAPGLLSAECVKSADGASYLAVTVNGDSADPRTDTIVGDVQVGPTILKDWGLHLIDMNVAMGDLVMLADAQAKAWAKTKR